MSESLKNWLKMMGAEIRKEGRDDSLRILRYLIAALVGILVSLIFISYRLFIAEIDTAFLTAKEVQIVGSYFFDITLFKLLFLLVLFVSLNVLTRWAWFLNLVLAAIAKSILRFFSSTLAEERFYIRAGKLFKVGMRPWLSVGPIFVFFLLAGNLNIRDPHVLVAKIDDLVITLIVATIFVEYAYFATIYIKGNVASRIAVLRYSTCNASIASTSAHFLTIVFCLYVILKVGSPAMLWIVDSLLPNVHRYHAIEYGLSGSELKKLLENLSFQERGGMGFLWNIFNKSTVLGVPLPDQPLIRTNLNGMLPIVLKGLAATAWNSLILIFLVAFVPRILLRIIRDPLFFILTVRVGFIGFLTMIFNFLFEFFALNTFDVNPDNDTGYKLFVNFLSFGLSLAMDQKILGNKMEILLPAYKIFQEKLIIKIRSALSKQ